MLNLAAAPTERLVATARTSPSQPPMTLRLHGILYDATGEECENTCTEALERVASERPRWRLNYFIGQCDKFVQKSQPDSGSLIINITTAGAPPSMAVVVRLRNAS